MKFNLTNASIAVAVFLAFLLGYKCSFVWNEYGVSHVFYPFSHANVFHLLANLVALLSFRKNVGIVAYIAAVAASFLRSRLRGIAYGRIQTAVSEAGTSVERNIIFSKYYFGKRLDIKSASAIIIML